MSCKIIAEAGNHNGDLELDLDLIEATARSGADAIKFQLRGLVSALQQYPERRVVFTYPKANAGGEH